MFKKTITFKDLDGNKITEDFYFHLSAAEAIKMELLGGDKGFSEKIQRIVQTEDRRAIVLAYDEILKTAYGKRSADNRRFQRSEEIWLDFFESDAYSVLWMELMTDGSGTAFADFMNALFPQELREKIAELEKEGTVFEKVAHPEFADPAETPAEPATDDEPWVTEDREPTSDELRRMTQPQLVAAFKRKDQRRQEQKAVAQFGG